MPDVPAGGAEFELLCRIAQPRPDLAQIHELLRRGVDFPRLVQLADDHGLQPSLIQCLGDLSWDAVPEDTRASLETAQRRHLVRMLTLVDEFQRIAALLSDNAITFATFKGPTLAMLLYGGLARRDYADIDLLVPQAEVDAAEKLLASLGYGSTQGDRAFRRAFLASQRQYALEHADGPGAVDLHWGLCGAHLPFPLTPADVWRDLVPVSIGGRSFPGIVGVNLALLLAGHGTKESWRLLKWVADFGRMIDRHRDLDWPDVHRRAATRGCGDAVLLACAISQELLAVPVPRELAGHIAGSDRVRRLAAALADRMRRAPPTPQPTDSFADLDLCDGRIGRMKAAVRLALTPTAGDYHALPMPRVLWPAYYVTRPFRLAVKGLARGGALLRGGREPVIG
jgi:hypothetical protein